ncbi:MAG: hypothetical protein WC378_05260 [Opitutaceae bacterium]|jgi:hypothetical protein
MKTRYTALIFGLALALTSALFIGCETTGANPPPVQQRTKAVFDAPKDKVWPLLVGEVGLEYPVRAIEKDSGLITTDWINLPAGYNNMNQANWVFALGGFLATWDGLRMNMKILAVELEPGKTQVTINCHYEAFESNVSKSWIVAQSNGSIENGILSKIEQQLPKK